MFYQENELPTEKRVVGLAWRQKRFRKYRLSAFHLKHSLLVESRGPLAFRPLLGGFGWPALGVTEPSVAGGGSDYPSVHCARRKKKEPGPARCAKAA